MLKTLRIVIIFIMAILLLTVPSNAFTMQMSTDKSEVKVGDEVVYTINLDEKVVAANFHINYNSSVLELIGSSSNGLDVAVKNGKVACIYADINGVGTNSFQIRFKAKAATTRATFSIENPKFRGINQDTSYVDGQITGLTTQTNITIATTNTNNNPNVNNSNDNTISPTTLPKAGANSYLIIMILFVAIMVAIISKVKFKKIKNILPLIIGIAMLGSLTYSIQAVTNNLTIDFSEINGSKIAKIMLPINDEDRSITKEEITTQNGSIISIKDDSQNEIENKQIIRTGYVLETASGTSTIVLLGDVNKDGYICDTDDIMVIINSHLGKSVPDDIAKISANLDDTNDTLDIKDITEMKNIFLGKQSGGTANNKPNTPNTPDDITTNLKILIAYFSHSGNTKIAAEEIQNQVGGELVQIKTVNEYPSDYTQCTEVAKAEKDTNARPELAENINTDNYDIIFVGYPIWWHTAPMAVLTFLESNNLDGKVVAPFCTSAGSSIEESMADIRKSSGNATLTEGITISGNSGNTDSGKQKISDWLNRIGIEK